MAVEGRQKPLLYLVLYVCSIGSALAPPMTPSEGVLCGFLRSAEAHGVEFALLGHTVGHTMYVQGVLAGHTSDIDKTHHRTTVVGFRYRYFLAMRYPTD